MSNTLFLYVYDLSKGMARQYSAMFLGKHFDGIWHTGLVLFGQEWFFGNGGIDSCPPKGTVLGEPDEIVNLGQTNISEDDFYEILRQLSESSYKVGSYNLLDHNCNNFSNDLAQILVGKPIPTHIVDLPKEILSTPMGPMLRPLLEQAADPIHQDGTHVNPLLARLRTAPGGASASASAAPAASSEPEVKLPSTSSVFKPNDILKSLSELIEESNQTSSLSLNDKNLLVEVKEYVQQTEIKWTIATNHIKLLIQLYLKTFSQSPEKQLVLLKVLQTVALNTAVAKILSQHSDFVGAFVPGIKQPSDARLVCNGLRVLSNVCTHRSLSKELLEKHQDLLFKEFSEYALVENPTDGDNSPDSKLSEACISFFFNLVSAFHLESGLSDSNALTLGCALLERLPKAKTQATTVYQMLSLLRSCLSVSHSMRELAMSMDFNLGTFRQEEAGSSTTSQVNSNDAYSNVVNNIENMIHHPNE